MIGDGEIGIGAGGLPELDEAPVFATLNPNVTSGFNFTPPL